jgi:hypothetical protein
MDRRDPDPAVAAAINRVLAAEREATGAIETARREAEAVMERARDERRLLLERARVRATRAHAAAQARLARRLAELETNSDGTRHGGSGLPEMAAVASERLARRLTAAT